MFSYHLLYQFTFNNFTAGIIVAQQEKIQAKQVF